MGRVNQALQRNSILQKSLSPSFNDGASSFSQRDFAAELIKVVVNKAWQPGGSGCSLIPAGRVIDEWVFCPRII